MNPWLIIPNMSHMVSGLSDLFIFSELKLTGWLEATFCWPELQKEVSIKL